MTGNYKDDEKKPIGVELKYCEHCGGLWVRERGAGVVYCEKCQPKVADLPLPKKKLGRLVLPVRPHTAIEDYKIDNEDEDESDGKSFEATAGGVA